MRGLRHWRAGGTASRDSPYLAPVPYRGKENEPAYVPAVGAALATAVGRDVATVAAETAAAARTWLGIPVTTV